MPALVTRLVLAAVVGVVVGLVCVLVGGLLASIGLPIADPIGSWLRAYAWVLGLLAALWYFFAGGGRVLP